MSVVQGANSLTKQGHQAAGAPISLDLELSAEKIHSLILRRAHAQPIQPDLQLGSKIRRPEAYKRLNDASLKDQFRNELTVALKSEWKRLYGSEKADALVLEFEKLAKNLDDNGAMIFGALLPKEAFHLLIADYNATLQGSGSKSWIHSFVNLANHPKFLTNPNFDGAFLHPLLVALISYRVGGPIRLVDARGKDAEPISVMAQDNMLHIDNTPFNDEYKIILTWERNKPSGPKGQNFVFIPGTNKGARNCFVTAEGRAWSSENASIFTTDTSIQKIFNFQKSVLNNPNPIVVEAQHPDKPLTTVFAAGSLVHHRYRTEGGSARSCMILAFHRAKDNPGQFIAPEHLDRLSDTDSLNSYLFGYHGQNSENGFNRALAKKAPLIANLLDRLRDKRGEAEVIQQKEKALSPKEFEKWKTIATQAPTIEQIKLKQNYFPLHQVVASEEILPLLVKMMSFDKHGPLDLILYDDSHEEIRKWARNQIREMKLDRLTQRLEEWKPHIQQPSEDQLLSPERLKAMANSLAQRISRQIDSQQSVIIDPNEKISQRDALRSLSQLLVDLGESIVRCEDRQSFLSTSLFLFWACDTFCGFQKNPDRDVIEIGKQLLGNYLSTAVLIEKQIEQEQAAKVSSKTTQPLKSKL